MSETQTKSRKRGTSRNNEQKSVKPRKGFESGSFEEKYIKFLKNDKNIKKLTSLASASKKMTMIITSLVILGLLLLLLLVSKIPGVFIVPLMLIVIVFLTIPSLYLFLRIQKYSKMFKVLTSMVKKLNYVKTSKAYIVRSKHKFYTFLVYDKNVSESVCLEELEKVKEIYKNLGSKQTFDSVKAEVIKAKLKGKLKITDFNSEKMTIMESDDYDFKLVQASFVVPSFKNRVVTGLIVNDNFLLFPPSVWIEKK